MRNHSRLARRQGLEALVVLVSFDCDTDEDLAVVGQVHEQMLDLGIRPSYAVPGALLEAGADIYRTIAGTGAEFLNHGYERHCRFDATTRRYVSSYFYDELPLDDVERDVRAGHDAVERVVGRRPTGFRTPHFGTFQRRGQLRWLHRLLASLGYRFSTSTTPLHGHFRGPVIGAHDVIELPVSGCPSAPRRVLDSWGFRFAPRPVLDESDYLDEVARLLDAFGGGARPGIVNLYADPSQVAGWAPFFEAMTLLAPHAAGSFDDVVSRLRR